MHNTLLFQGFKTKGSPKPKDGRLHHKSWGRSSYIFLKFLYFSFGEQPTVNLLKFITENYRLLEYVYEQRWNKN